MGKTNLVCVNVGDKYSPDCVERLFSMVMRNTTREFNFYCLTDNPSHYSQPIIPLPLTQPLFGWWNKMFLFKPGILPDGKYLYFDLDVVIIDNIDSLFEFDGFGIARDFVRPDRGILGGKEYNSSVMKFTQNSRLWEFFESNQESWQFWEKKCSFFGDQNVISAFLNSQNYSNHFPDDWIWSYKCGSTRGVIPVSPATGSANSFLGTSVPAGGKVCVFHGRPHPSEVSDDWVLKNYAVDLKNVFHKPKISVEKTSDNYELTIQNKKFLVANHWFWKQFSDQWEPHTYNFFEQNLIKGTGFLDIGGWIGPTSLIATAIGAGKVKIIEPNPVNFFHLLSTQLNNKLLAHWCMVNACISNKSGTAKIGPLEGITSGSSATNTRNPKQQGAEILSLKLEDILHEIENFSLVKIDIGGAEELIISDLFQLSSKNLAIWLSIHPPFYADKTSFLEKLINLSEHFIFVDSNNMPIAHDVIENQVLSDLEKPEWGTKWGNFFEIGLLSKSYFYLDNGGFKRAEQLNSKYGADAA